MDLLHLTLIAFALLPGFCAAQGTISTVAGGNGLLDNIPATAARLDGPRAAAVDSQGNAYISDGLRIRRVDAKTGVISTVAGNGTPYTSDGRATEVGLDAPSSFAFDSAGNLLFLFALRARVMKLDFHAGTVSTIASNYGPIAIQSASALATDRAGNIYVTDDYNGRINRIDAVTNALTLVPGLSRPNLIAVDPAGNIFFAEQYLLRRLDAQTGLVTTIMSISPTRNVGTGGGDGGPVDKAVLVNPTALATDSKGNLYIADFPRIRKIDWVTGIISTVAGSGEQQYAKDGVPALQANLSLVYGMSVDAAGTLWLADANNRRLFVVPAATGLIRTVAGTTASGDGGPALGALLFASGIAISPQGDLYIAENSAIRRVDHASGLISTIAQAARTDSYAGQLAFDAAGNLLLAASDRVSRIDVNSGNVSVVAGGHFRGFSGDDGPATSAEVSAVAAAVDAAGNIYIADYWNYRVRRVDAKTGIITTIAGNGHLPLGQIYAGDKAPATQIAIGVPTSIAVSPAGDVYWTTAGHVLKVNSNGILSIVAGNGGGCLYAGDGGPALQAVLCQPYGLAFDRDGSLFVGEGTCGCVRRIDGATGVIQTVAGNGTTGVSADFIPATQAALTVGGIALAGTSLYLIDYLDNQHSRIRLVTPAIPPSLPQPPKISQVVNAVDYRPFYSPGEIVSIMGNYLAAPTPATAQLAQNGRITTALAGDVVRFSGTAGPLLYVSAGQINAVVPYAVSLGKTPVEVQTVAGKDALNITVQQTSLGVFAGLIFNPDGSLNASSNPAPKGATLVLYGTGMGQTVPPGVDGATMQGPALPTPVSFFGASVRNGTAQIPAAISYLGPMPGFVAGAMQVNVRVPDSVPPGESSLMLASGSSSTETLTIFMRSDRPVLTGITPTSLSYRH